MMMRWNFLFPKKVSDSQEIEDFVCIKDYNTVAYCTWVDLIYSTCLIPLMMCHFYDTNAAKKCHIIKVSREMKKMRSLFRMTLRLTSISSVLCSVIISNWLFYGHLNKEFLFKNYVVRFKTLYIFVSMRFFLPFKFYSSHLTQIIINSISTVSDRMYVSMCNNVLVKIT